MAKFGKKKKYTDWLYTKPTVFVLGILIIFLSVAVIKRFGVERDMNNRRVTAEKELQESQDRKAHLEDEVEYLEGERGIEEEIRKHFDVAREGETVVILTGEENDRGVDTKAGNETNIKWYQFWR